MRAEPRRSVPAPILERIVHTAFPGRRVRSIQPLGDGLRNANFKLALDPAGEPAVLRIYEHDPSLCQKEIDLMRLVRGSVPVPEVIHAEPRGWEDLPPFTLARWVEGIAFRDLNRTGDTEAIAQAAQAAGETLAAIGRFGFAKPGWIAPGPTVGPALLEGADAVPRFVDLCLASANFERRVDGELRDRTHSLIGSWAARLATLDGEASLVHGDFNKRNLLLRRAAGCWQVSAVLDWEFAVSASPLADLGSFLRYERAARPVAEPHFSAAYARAGGTLPDGWRRLARCVDLVALCESLTHDDLPDAVTSELVELVRATVEEGAYPKQPSRSGPAPRQISNGRASATAAAQAGCSLST
jgi:aminoglycoside phosphotransferase (APT) family kinase protein